MSDVPMIPEEILQKVCSTWSGWDSGLKGYQIEQDLGALSIPDVSPNASKADRLYEALSLAQDSTRSGKVVIDFIERVMSPVRYIGEVEKFNNLKGRINQALAFAGLRLEDDGRIVPTDRVSTLVTVEVSQQTSSNLSLEHGTVADESVHVFISYSRQDHDLVSSMRETLTQAGVHVWLDQDQIAPGTPNWQIAIRQGIHQASVVIYAASPTAASSTYVIQELDIARGEGKSVIPFWIRGEDNKWYDASPLGMSSMQYIDGRGEKFRNGLATLCKMLIKR